MNNKQHVAKISKVIFRNSKNHYSILLGWVDGESETLIGYFPVINEGMEISFFGKKEIGRNRREQFKVESYSIELPKTVHQLYNFLINDFINMDLIVAGHVVDKIGLEYIHKYKDSSFLINKLGKEYYDVNKEYLDEAILRISEIQNRLNLMEEMVKMGFPNDVSSKVAFSEILLKPHEIRENPYMIIFPFDLDWKTVDRIALKNGIPKDSELRIHEGVCYLLDEAVAKLSHIFLPRDELLVRLNRLLNLQITLDQFKTYEKKLEDLKRIYCDVELNIYGYRYFIAEQQLSMDLFRLRDGEAENEELVNRLLSEIKNDEMTYSPEQFTAIKSALLNSLTVISGAAGTGKTTVLSKIIELLEKMKNTGKKFTDDDYYRICLCAPTGKASERLSEVTGRNARTIHSLLVIHPLHKTPQYHLQNQLEFDCIIIDEASMNDTILFSYILNAAKNNCKIIIVGDENQLPSIGPGNVLSELLKSDEFFSIHLSRVYRQGEDSAILDFATAVRNGNTEINDVLYKKSEDFTFIEQRNMHQIADIIVKTMDILHTKKHLDFYTDIQIATPIHKSVIGTIELNSRIQELLNSKGKRKKLTVGDKDFYVDDKVIHTVNNSEKKVFNGETGRIIDISQKTLLVEYPRGKQVTYTGDEIFELDLAFALSVHKMQGSESAIVIFPVHRVYGNMLQRRLLYTGATRAKKKLLLIGELEAILGAIENDSSESRNCNLSQRIIESRLAHLFR